MDFTEKTLNSTEIYRGKVLNLRVDKVELPNGEQSTREVINHNGSAAAVPILDNGNILLVRQFRYAVGEHVLEIPAGKIDAGEHASGCIYRELTEEIEMAPKRLRYLHSGYYGTGYCNEKIWLYLARELEPCENPKDKDEFIEIIEMPFEEAHQMVVTGVIKDAKTALGILLAKPWINSPGNTESDILVSEAP